VAFALLASLGAPSAFAQAISSLKAQTTVEEAEREYPGLPNDPRVARFPDIVKPFGFESGRWEALKAKMQSGDQLWKYSDGVASGFALVRDGRVIDSINTLMR
jgi:hypothetical protein